MLAPRTLKPIRDGFTLVEMLVVIAILGILAALVAAGIFAVIGNQSQTATQNTMRAVNKVLARQMKYVLDKAEKEPIPANVLNLAGGDAKLARVIWKKLRLKQEFPMTFAEALTPSYPANCVFVSPPASPASAPPITATDLPALPAYTKILAPFAGTSINWQGQPFLESSICLLLALQQSRGGAALTPDQLGAAAVAVQIKNTGQTLTTQQSQAISGLKMLVDNWGVEMAFFRFPTSNDDTTIPLNNDLDNQSPAGAAAASNANTGATFRDPYDPEGRLVNPNWNNFANWNNGNRVYQFEQYCHLVHFPNASAYATPSIIQITASNYNSPSGALQPGAWSRYMLPTLVSAGPDGKWGLNNVFSTSYSFQTTPTYYYAVGVNPDMSLDPNTIGDSADNIYSYRLGLGE